MFLLTNKKTTSRQAGVFKNYLISRSKHGHSKEPSHGNYSLEKNIFKTESSVFASLDVFGVIGDLLFENLGVIVRTF